MSNKILNEATVRRFQALANIPGLKESHGRGQHEGEGTGYVSGREDLEEAIHEEEDEMDEYDLGGLMQEQDEEEEQEDQEEEEQEDQEEEEQEDEEEDEDEDMPQAKLDLEGGMDKGKIEDALEKALRAMADSLASDLNLSIDVVAGGEEAAEMAPEVGATPALEAPPAPEEEEMATMAENVRRLVNKVEKRVAQRIKTQTLEEALIKRVAARLLAAKKDDKKVAPKPAVKPPVKKK
jgi:hypothetical protein